MKGGVQWVGKPHKLINTAEGKINSYIYPRYAEKKWPIAQKRYATMIARLSDSFEDLIQTLKDLNIDKNTVIIMTSDNGPHDEGGQNPQFSVITGLLTASSRMRGKEGSVFPPSSAGPAAFRQVPQVTTLPSSMTGWRRWLPLAV